MSILKMQLPYLFPGQTSMHNSPNTPSYHRKENPKRPIKRKTPDILTTSQSPTPLPIFTCPSKHHKRPNHFFFPINQSFPLSANPFAGLASFSSSPMALSHFELSCFALAISSGDGLKIFAAPPRPTCVELVDSLRGCLKAVLLIYCFLKWVWEDGHCRETYPRTSCARLASAGSSFLAMFPLPPRPVVYIWLLRVGVSRVTGSWSELVLPMLPLISH